VCECRFTGLATAHCVRCHRTFTSESAFTAHQRWPDICLDPAAATRRNGTLMFKLDAHGYWCESTGRAHYRAARRPEAA
jgi:hypothetical protein